MSIYSWSVYVWSVGRSPWRSDLELESQGVSSHHVDVRNQTQVFCNNIEHSPVLRLGILKKGHCAVHGLTQEDRPLRGVDTDPRRWVTAGWRLIQEDV